MKSSEIKEAIYKIGVKMVQDHLYYSDVVNDPANGIVPRCLIYEEEGRDLYGRGSVMVGINPGRANETEREFYQRRGAAYEATLEYWDEKIKSLRYYKRGRALVDGIGLHGPILWTELVKCESPKGVKLSVQTIRDSINLYLFEELKVIPENWPLIGIGYKAFEILAYRFPKRTVIGIPHITGSYGQFNKLFTNKINPRAKQQLEKILKGKSIATAFKCRNGSCCFDV